VAEEFEMGPLQCRAARALLDWTQADLAAFSGVSSDTVGNFEAGRISPRPASLREMGAAFEAAGVIFIDKGEAGFGIMMMKSDWPAQFRAARCLLRWTHFDVAEASGVSDATVMRFETGQGAPRRASLKAIRRAFVAAGIVFVEGDANLAGVTLKRLK